MPKSRTEFWIPKLQRNRERDMQVQEEAREAGWEYLVIWECETKDRGALADKLVYFLDGDEKDA